jgi:hypothetical protein
MKISRRGASADHGESSVELKTPSFVWQKFDSSLAIKRANVKDFSSKSRHDYKITFGFSELVNLINTLSEAAIAEPMAMERGLEPSLKALIRLQTVVAGLKT